MGVLLITMALVSSGCYSTRTDGGVQASLGGYSATGETFVVHVTATSSRDFCLVSLDSVWADDAGTTTTDLPNNTSFCHRTWTIDLQVPTRLSGGVLRIRSKSREWNPFFFGEDAGQAYSDPLTIPAPTTASPVAVAAVVFAQQSPAGASSMHVPDVANGTLIDARQSTGTGALSYAWGDGCSDTQSLPAGMARVVGGWTGTCTVTVTDSSGQTGTASTVVTSAAIQNGSITFPSGTSANVYGSLVGPWVHKACVDLNGGTNYATYYDLSSLDLATGVAYTSVPLTALTPGLHRISAVLMVNGHSSGDCSSVGSITADPEYVQTVSALYSVAADGSVSAPRRGGRAAVSFVAPSSLRFVSKKTISEGTVDKATGAVVGATASGTFAWALPKSVQGVKRPAGAAQLTKGTYVMRSISMMQGPKTGASTLLLGTGTVLLRGVSGTLACGTIAGTFDSSTLTLAGGTGTARTLAGAVTGKPIGYVFPKAPKKPTKKPTKKPVKTKPAKVKPVKARGTATLQTAAKATELPAACKALVQYLPR